MTITAAMPTNCFGASDKTMEKIMKVSSEELANRIDASFQLRVGQKKVSYKSLSELTGITIRTLRSYREESFPTAAGLLSLCGALGPGFTSEILSIIDQSARPGSNDEPEHMQTLCCLTRLAAQIAEAVEDGHVDHREAAQLRPVAQELIEMLEPIARAHVQPIKRGAA